MLETDINHVHFKTDRSLWKVCGSSASQCRSVVCTRRKRMVKSRAHTRTANFHCENERMFSCYYSSILSGVQKPVGDFVWLAALVHSLCICYAFWVVVHAFYDYLNVCSVKEKNNEQRRITEIEMRERDKWKFEHWAFL